MTAPNFDNIDRWLFDYVEGNLSSNQESILENYILNHPELEVDLDMWRMSNIKMSNSFVNDIHIAKKTSNRKVYTLINTLGILLILLIGRQVHFNQKEMISDGQLSNKKTSLNLIDSKQGKTTITPTHSNSNNNPELGENSVTLSRLNIENFEYSNRSNLSGISTSTLTSTEESITAPAGITSNDYQLDRLSISKDLSFSNLDIEYRLKNQDHLEVNNNNNNNDSKSFDFKGFKLKDKTKNFVNRIDQILSKNVALSNYRDHHYLIPQVSSIDANLSTVGSVSQSRMQSVSRVRWHNSNQHKYSQQLTFDTYARAIRSGIGAQVSYDYFADGSIQDWHGALIVSPKIALSRKITLEPVAKLKIGNTLLDATKAENNSLALFNIDSPQMFSYDTSLNIGRKLWYRDLDFGLTLNTGLFYIGAQASNVLNHSENIYQNNQNTNYKTPTVYSLFAGTQYVSRNEKLSFHPYFYMRSVNKNNQYYGGFSLNLDKLFIGAAADFKNQYTGSLGLSLDRFAVILQSTKSFNLNLNQHLYTHQLTIRINSDISKKTRRYITF